jgi:hypothetical protein
MQRLSSNLTLFFKVFLPIMWLVFFGATTLAFFAGRSAGMGFEAPLTLKLVMLVIFLSGAAFLYFTLLNLKRVELGPEGAFVSNYFTHLKYKIEDVESITVTSFLILSVATLRLKSAGTFGQNIRFIPSGSNFRPFWDAYPELKAKLMPERK